MKRLALLEPGTRIDRYLVLDTLGQGGMAVVYRVRHESLGSLHALKVVVAPSRQVMQRLLAEGKAQARLRHRNIVMVNDVIEVEGSPGLVMEYVPGPSLEKLIRNVSLDLDTIDRLGRQILRGIGAAHEAGLVHRDLKPANILCSFEEDGLVPKIADFGLVKDLGAQAGDTRTGSVMGTPNYMSPEQIRDTKSVDHRTDLFAMGAILYELCTRQLAFDGDDLLDIFNRVAEGRHVPVRDLRPDVPDRMVAAIEQALQVRREDRPGSAQALLDTWCGDVADRALPAFSLPEETVEWIKSATLVPPDVTPRPAPAAGETVGWNDDDPEAPASPTLAPETASPTLAPDPDASPPSIVTGPRMALASLGLLGAVAVVGCLGVGGIGLVVGGTWLGETPTEVALDPEPDPVPIASPVAPPSTLPPEPRPVPDAPVAIVPAPPVPAPPPRDPRPDRPAPEVPVPVAPLPARPVPEPAPSQGGSVRVLGVTRAMLQAPGAGAMIKPADDVKPGPYDVLAWFGSDAQPVSAISIVVTTGKTVTVDCSPVMRKCRQLP